MRAIGIDEIKTQLKAIADKASKQSLEEAQAEFHLAVQAARQETQEFKMFLIIQQQRTDTRVTRVLESAVEKQNLMGGLEQKIGQIEDQINVLKRQKANTLQNKMAEALRTKVESQIIKEVVKPVVAPKQPDYDVTAELNTKFTEQYNRMRLKVDEIELRQRQVINKVGGIDYKSGSNKTEVQQVQDDLKSLSRDVGRDVQDLRKAISELSKKFDEKIRR